jgi:two-component system, NarL family, nitrate/nitrite response regulator NarL
MSHRLTISSAVALVARLQLGTGPAMISIVIAAERQLLRQLLHDALDERTGITVVATAPSAARVLALRADLQPDVVVVSMEMPGSLDLVRALLDQSARVVALGRCDEAPVAVVEDGILQDVVAAVHGAMHGAYANTITPPSEFEQLTPTERRVLHEVNDGRSNKEIARELGVAVPTVKHHVHNVLSKLGVSRRAEAAALYRRTAGSAPRATAPAYLTLRTTSAR